ncbi:MAG: helix-turn-helix domain-containing protein, partial [Catenulispora sp.]|nr:helix-turn-helix domain-containing protein [Catenulispora sp.]
MTEHTGTDPSKASDLAEFSALLGQLVTAHGLSTRDLAKRVGPLMRPPQTVAKSTIHELFATGRRRLNLDLVVAVVRALGLPPAEVDAWRQACVRMHGAAKTGGPEGVFRQLPADTAAFTGREAALRAVLDAADTVGDGAAAVVISAIEGMAGIGKTQLAVHAAHALVRDGRFTDLQLFVNLRGFDPDRPPADPAAVLDSFLRQLGVPAQQIPDGLDALVVLDNAADEKQVRELIPASPSCLVLITSRRSLAGLTDTATVFLDTLDAAESVRLLARIVGAERVGAEPEAADRVAA